MSTTKSNNNNPNNPIIVKKNSTLIRFWHWNSALVVIGSLLTVLINTTLFDRGNYAVVLKSLVIGGGEANEQQAKEVLLGFEDQIWDIHIYFGYALAALLILRLIVEFMLPNEKRIFNKVRIAYLAYFQKNKARRITRPDLLAKSLYMIFYLLLILMVCTGLTIAFENEIGISKNISHQIKEVHGFIMYLIFGFIVIHILGVVLAENNQGKGIVSDMINGGEEIKN